MGAYIPKNEIERALSNIPVKGKKLLEPIKSFLVKAVIDTPGKVSIYTPVYSGVFCFKLDLCCSGLF